jgi:hypothetical protein
MNNDDKTDLVINGTWYYDADHPSVHGTLKISHDNIEIDLYFGESHHISPHDLIDEDIMILRGVGQNGLLITLIKCHPAGVSLTSGNILTAQYWCEDALLNSHLDDPDEAKYQSVSIIFGEPISRFTRRIDTIDIQKLSDSEFNTVIRFNTEKTLNSYVLESDSVDLKITTSLRKSHNSFECKSHFVIDVSSNHEKRSIRTWRTSVERYRYFFSIVLGCTLSVQMLHVREESGKGMGIRLIPPACDALDERGPRIAYTYTDVQGSLDGYLSSWAEKLVRYESTCSIIFQQNEASIPIETGFLTYFQAIEAIYRAGLYEKPRGKLLSDFNPIKKRLLKIIEDVKDSRFQAVASQRIKQLNELPLGDKVRCFCDSFETNVVILLGIDNDAIKELNGLRNRLTHMTEGTLLEDVNISKLLKWMTILRFLIILFMMKELGFDELDSANRLRSTENFADLIGGHTIERRIPIPNERF